MAWQRVAAWRFRKRFDKVVARIEIVGLMRMVLAGRAAGVAMLFAGVVCVRGEGPKFDEVLGLVRTNLTTISAEEFDRAATAGLLDKLQGRVEMAEPGGEAESSKLIGQTNVFSGGFGYVRIERVRAGLGSELAAAVKGLKENGGLKGLVVDLRFASGTDYAGAVEAANVFLGTPETVLKWGAETGKADGKGEGADLPLAALVNKETRGAGEALAAILRDQRLGLVIGQPTAGQAVVFEEFKLSTGQTLRIGRGKVELPNGNAIGGEGLKPDILVEANLEAERRWMENPFLASAAGVTPSAQAPFLTTLTNRLPRRINGAEVGRRHRDETESAPGTETTPREAVPAKVVQDPALARALDFLKGLTLPRLREAGK